MAKEAAKNATNKNAKEKKSFGKRITRFFQDLKSEIKKVVWPSKRQTRNNTLAVLGFTAVTAVFIWILDLILSTVVRLVLG